MVIQQFIKASRNFREIHYHFSVPASRQLIQTGQASYTILLVWAVVAGLWAGPKVAVGQARWGREMASKLQAGLGRKFLAHAHLYCLAIVGRSLFYH